MANHENYHVSATLRSRRSAACCDLQLTFVNRGSRTVRLEKLKIGPPLIEHPTIQYNCFVFGCKNEIEPDWKITPKIFEPTDSDFITLAPGEEYGSDWMPFGLMYDISTMCNECTSLKYRGHHEAFWPETQHDSAFMVVESNWVHLPKKGKIKQIIWPSLDSSA